MQTAIGLEISRRTQEGLVRLALPGDVEQIAELYHNSFPEHIMVQRGLLNNPTYIAEHLDIPDERWVIESLAEEVRGVGALAIIPPVGLGEIERVCVSRPHRGQGISERICSRLVDEARDAGLGFVEAFARGDQPAMQRTNEKLGFKVYGVSPRFEIMDDGQVMREQFVHMGLELKPESVKEKMDLIPAAQRVFDRIHG